MASHLYAIGLGSNRRHGRFGSPAAVLRGAVAELAAAGLAIEAHSAIIATAPLGPSARRFANAAIVVRTALDPSALLDLLKRIEVGFGRRRGRRWGSRVLDLDILLWSGGCWHRTRGPALHVPHREMERRDFVLRPLEQVAPSWRIGRSARSVRHARHRLRRRSG
ncbi:2-amino-4-hydroxy-6-hydroxymethyldihydropteridine diphosphokinase [Rhizorhabdus phycosphaerae]|uniref:2-amino-4-hydroxy-6- hydroxymethyldihydropteridine diphosphokinase n=1 Tax=Rhizorhabdus phycosphaerae TaxID=2711156 RepID=UPI0013E9A707|nr:2-amino-4-hydroxy-6-hydroxymethyldihydropteridine diphosphokinase [Rhizorhabdus phycosphaerae]